MLYYLVVIYQTSEQRGVIQPIYKTKGDINDPANYRGITLLSYLRKLFTSVINEILTVFIDSHQLMNLSNFVTAELYTM